MEKVTKAQITTWINHPITQIFINSLESIRESNKKDLEDLVLNSSLTDLKNNAYTLVQLRGQILILDNIKDVKSFIIEELELLGQLEITNV